MRFVKERSGAIGVYPAGEAPYGVKVLTVDRKSQQDPAYPLAE